MGTRNVPVGTCLRHVLILIRKGHINLLEPSAKPSRIFETSRKRMRMSALDEIRKRLSATPYPVTSLLHAETSRSKQKPLVGDL